MVTSRWSAIGPVEAVALNVALQALRARREFSWPVGRSLADMAAADQDIISEHESHVCAAGRRLVRKRTVNRGEPSATIIAYASRPYLDGRRPRRSSRSTLTFLLHDVAGRVLA